MIAANVNITANIIQISRYVNFVVVGKLLDELANNVDKISRQLWNEFEYVGMSNEIIYEFYIDLSIPQCNSCSNLEIVLRKIKCQLNQNQETEGR